MTFDRRARLLRVPPLLHDIFILGPRRHGDNIQWLNLGEIGIGEVGINKVKGEEKEARGLGLAQREPKSVRRRGTSPVESDVLSATISEAQPRHRFVPFWRGHVCSIGKVRIL